MEKIFILIFIWHFIFFAEGSCDNFKNDVVLLTAPMIIVKYFRKNVFKNKLTRGFLFFVFFFFFFFRNPTQAKRLEANIATKTSEKTRISKTSII